MDVPLFCCCYWPVDVVLLAVLKGGYYELLLTVRSEGLSRHPGEVAFPGGMRDPTDVSPEDTALREAEEEIGLNRSLVTIVSVLPPFRNRFNIGIFPVIAVLTDGVKFKPVLSANEV